MIGERPTCQFCGNELDLTMADAETGEEYELECDACGAKSKVMPDTRIEWNEKIIEPGNGLAEGIE